MKKVIDMKKENRDVIESIIIKFFGVVMIILGGLIFCVSIPLILFIIGIFSMFGALIIIIGGIDLIRISKYKSEEIECLNCGFKIKNNYGRLKQKQSFKCKKCKEMVLIK